MLNEASGSKFMSRKWNIVTDQSNRNYDSENLIIFIREVLKSNICDYNDAFIPVRDNTSTAGNVATRVVFKNCAPFTKCITKIDGMTISETEDIASDSDHFKSFKYKTKLIGRTAATSVVLEDAVISVPLKYLSNFWTPLEMSLIN